MPTDTPNSPSVGKLPKKSAASAPVASFNEHQGGSEPSTVASLPEVLYTDLDIRAMAIEFSIGVNADNRARGAGDVIEDAKLIEQFLKEVA